MPALRPGIGALVDAEPRPRGCRPSGVSAEPGVGDAAAVAGFRVGRSPACGRYMYVGDLAPLPETRGAGYGRRFPGAAAPRVIRRATPIPGRARGPAGRPTPVPVADAEPAGIPAVHAPGEERTGNARGPGLPSVRRGRTSVGARGADRGPKSRRSRPEADEQGRPRSLASGHDLDDLFPSGAPVGGRPGRCADRAPARAHGALP